MNDLANNDQFNQTETRFKAAIAIASLSATIVETAAVSVEKSVEHPLGAFIRSQWGVDAKLAGVVAKMARRVGAIAGVIAGIYDILFNARDAARTGNSLLSQLYVINGFLGIAFPIAIYFSAGALFWPLLIFSFGIGIAIAFVSAGALKSWISRCEFSIGERYTSFDEQVDAYRKAVGA